MELVTGNLKELEKEVKFLIDRLCRNLNLSEMVATILSLDILSELYYDVTGLKIQELEKHKNNKCLNYKMSKVRKQQEIQENEFMENFIKNKEFHNLVINNLLYKMNEKIEFLSSMESGIILSSKEMYDIMREYLGKKNMDGYLNDIISKKRIFYGNSDEFYEGYMAYNVVHDIPHILINKDMSSVEMMTVIVHEIGHIEDYSDLSRKNNFKTVNDYYMKPIYREVISKKTEKEFLDFLIENNIAPKDSCCMVEDYYLDITSHLEDLLILTNFDDRILRREKYCNLSIGQIIDEMLIGQIIDEMVEKDTIVRIDEALFKSLAYGYGGILAIYFEFLRKNDPNQYQYCYQNFLAKRANDFSYDDFLSFVPQHQKLSDIITQEMDKDIKVKQKIYHEN